MKKNCVVCGAEFEAKGVHNKFCSKKCQKKNWANNNKGLVNSMNRNWRNSDSGSIKHKKSVDKYLASEKAQIKKYRKEIERQLAINLQFCIECGKKLKLKTVRSNTRCVSCQKKDNWKKQYEKSKDTIKYKAKGKEKRALMHFCHQNSKSKISDMVIKTCAISYAFRHGNLTPDILDHINKGETHYAYAKRD